VLVPNVPVVIVVLGIVISFQFEVVILPQEFVGLVLNSKLIFNDHVLFPDTLINGKKLDSEFI
jgi:hypothetical protein